MSVQTYKCTNCSGGLIFDPKSQNFICEYCHSSFTKEQVKAMEKGTSEKETEPVTEETEFITRGYSCPSCDAEVVTDATTVATECYYCHNPVVMSDRLSGNFQPNAVVPFTIEKEQAKDGLLGWIKKKKFIPRDFYSHKQVEKITGVYFPIWYVDADVSADMTATATRVRSWQDTNFRYTETSFFNVQRSGNMFFDDIPKKALDKDETKLYETVLPFDVKKAEEFTAAYLSGFQAEKRNIETDALLNEVKKEVSGYSEMVLRDTIQGYATVTPTSNNLRKMDLDWTYALLPVWVMTYKDRNKKIFYYAMNGQSGKVAGELPLDRKKLLFASGAISAVTLGLLLLGGYFLL